MSSLLLQLSNEVACSCIWIGQNSTTVTTSMCRSYPPLWNLVICDTAHPQTPKHPHSPPKSSPHNIFPHVLTEVDGEADYVHWEELKLLVGGVENLPCSHCCDGRLRLAVPRCNLDQDRSKDMLVLVGMLSC